MKWRVCGLKWHFNHLGGNIPIFVVGWQAKRSAEPVAYMISLKRLKGLWDISLCKYITKFSKLTIERWKLTT